MPWQTEACRAILKRARPRIFGAVPMRAVPCQRTSMPWLWRALPRDIHASPYGAVPWNFFHHCPSLPITSRHFPSLPITSRHLP